MTRFDVVITWTTANAPQIGAVLVVGTVLAAIAEVALREKCNVCGKRQRIPMAGHWLLEHAGDREAA